MTDTPQPQDPHAFKSDSTGVFCSLCGARREDSHAHYQQSSSPREPQKEEGIGVALVEQVYFGEPHAALIAEIQQMKSEIASMVQFFPAGAGQLSVIQSWIATTDRCLLALKGE